MVLGGNSAKYQNGYSATCRCRRPIGALLLALAVFQPAQLSTPYMAVVAALDTYVEYQNGYSATCCCRRSIGGLLLALAIFPACPALHSIHDRRCCSGYLLPSDKMVTLQLALAEDPLEPCCWLLPYFLPCPALHSIHGRRCCSGYVCRVSTWILCNLPLEKIQSIRFHWRLAAGSGHISCLPSSPLHT